MLTRLYAVNRQLDDDVRFSWRKGIKAKERQYYGEDYSSENIKYRIYNKRYLRFLLV